MTNLCCQMSPLHTDRQELIERYKLEPHLCGAAKDGRESGDHCGAVIRFKFHPRRFAVARGLAEFRSEEATRSLDAVMENYHRSGAQIIENIFDNSIGRQFPIVAGVGPLDERESDSLEGRIQPEPSSSIRGTKELGGKTSDLKDGRLSLFYFLTNAGPGETIEVGMGVSVIADGVSFNKRPFENLGIQHDVAAAHEECCRRTILLKNIEDTVRARRVGSVIKSECDVALVRSASD